MDVKNVCVFVSSWILGFWSSATTIIIITTTTTTARSLEQLILGPEYHLSHLSHLAAFEDQTQKVERFLSPSLWSPWRRLSFDGTSKSCSFGTLCGLEHHRYGPLIRKPRIFSLTEIINWVLDKQIIVALRPPLRLLAESIHLRKLEKDTNCWGIS